MYTIYKHSFLFTRTDDNWEWKHLVLNGKQSCMTFHLLQCLNLSDLGLEWNVLEFGGWGKFHSNALTLV